MPAILFVALGGACGALARYGAGRLVAHLVDHPFPWSTWTVNLLGCLLIGLSLPLLKRIGPADGTHLFLVVGFLGSFTTFSTYSVDTLALSGTGYGLLSLLNAVGSLAFGLLLVMAGRALGTCIFGT